MEIILRGVKASNRQKVEADLEAAFADPPMVNTLIGGEAGGTVHAKIIYAPGDKRDPKTVENIIDTVIMNNGYTFFSAEHVHEKSEPAPEPEQPGGWSAL